MKTRHFTLSFLLLSFSLLLALQPDAVRPTAAKQNTAQDNNGHLELRTATSTGTTTRVSVASDGTQGNASSLGSPSISADGRYAAFQSSASNLVSGDTNNTDDVFLHDLQTGQTTRISIASDGTQGNGGSYGPPSISANGQYVVFSSDATNLVDGDTNGLSDVFVHNRVTEQTERISMALDGTEGNLASSASSASSISADGRYVVFESRANNLIVNGTNGWTHIFVHDRVTGQIEIISVASDGTQGNKDSHFPSISADGHNVAFESDATNLVSNDSNLTDIFVRDWFTGQTVKVSVASDGTSANGYSYSVPSISADGRYVAFASGATNLVSDDNNSYYDVFVHDQITGQTERISVSSDGAEGNHRSVNPSISANGRYVAFMSGASNLIANDTKDSIENNFGH